MKLVDAIKEKIDNYKNVTFAELERWFPEHFSEDKEERYFYGPRGIENVVYWVGLSKEFVQALNTLKNEMKYDFGPAQFLTYLCDGKILRLPLLTDKKVKQAAKIGTLKTLHWMPIVINPPLSPKMQKYYENKAKKIKWAKPILERNAKEK